MSQECKIKIIKSPKKTLKIKRTQARWFSIHSHSKYSAADALPSVEDMVKRAKELGYRGLGLTDHGNIAGTVRLYQECKKVGIKPFPGSELYIVHDREDKKAKRYHMGVLAYTEEGYRNLVNLSTLSHKNFHHKPLLDFADLGALADEGRLKGLVVTTGCFFGIVIQTLINDGYDAAKQVVSMLAEWFDHCYVEFQYHNIDQEQMSEWEIIKELAGIAGDLGLLCVTTQDCHYINEEDKKDHETMKRLVTWSDDASEATFPGDGFHMADDAWMKTHPDSAIYEWGLFGLEHLLSIWDLHIPEMDEYHPNIPSKHEDPSKVLRERVLAEYDALELPKKYLERIEDELDVINFNGMASYILLVAEVTDYCREHGIFFQARGSASGSAVCWLMGITPLDPIKWGLLMERFLSKTRLKMPDIDLDIQSSRRQELVDYLSLNYSISQIGTWAKLGLGEEAGKGSIWVKVFARLRKDGREAKADSLTQEEWDELESFSKHEAYSGTGKHAGGLIMLGKRADLEALVPQMWIASSKTMVSQYDMKDVEKLGLVKLDALGLGTMDTLQQTIVNMGRDPREMMDFIPLNDKATFAALSKGDTDGVFQLEGYAMRLGVKQMKPKNIDDVVATVALFRPATMNNGSTQAYLDRRFKRKPVPVRHPILADATATTQGILLYQEQMITVLQDLGMNADHLTKVLKAIKSSNGNVSDANQTLMGVLDEIKELAEQADMSDEDLEFLQEALLGYAEYGFNRSHAAVYGITAYQCAWLATHHPAEFHAALLSTASTNGHVEKERGYLSAARRRGVRISRPEVNASGTGYRAAGSSVAKGYHSIPGVGEKAAANLVENQPYRDIVDFAEKVNPRVVTGTNDLKKLLKKADGDMEEFSRLFYGHEFPGIVGKLKSAGVFRLMVKEI